MKKTPSERKSRLPPTSSDLPFVVWSADASGRWLDVNPAWEHLTGQILEDALGLGWLSRVLPAERERILAGLIEAADSSEPVVLQCHLYDADEKAHASLLTIRSAGSDGKRRLHGSAVHLPLDGRDATTPTAEGLEQDLGFKSMVENLPDFVARVDVQGRHLFVNPAVHRVLGLRPEDMLGRTYLELGLPEDVAHAHVTALARVIEHGGEDAVEFSLAAGERTNYFTTRFIPEFDDAHRVKGALSLTYDVTLQTEALLERDALLMREQSSRMQAEAAARARDEFLAIVSHELRSPLNGIQSWTHVLEAYVPGDQPLVTRALAGIKIGVQQQVRLIDDLLDATLIMSGKLQLNKGAMTMDECIRAAAASLAAEAEEKRISVELQLPEQATLMEGDAKRAEQIVWNLLSNAIKFTPEGGRVGVALSYVEGDAVIVVKDNGRGIPAQFLPYLFDPFRQVDGSSTRRAGGIGLGLTLVRRLAELHGGRVAAESPGPDLGSTFTVRIPAGDGLTPATAPLTLKRAHAGSFQSLSGMSVILVDDLREARDSLAQLLEQAGGQVRTFESGAAVAEYLREVAADGRPDVLISDVAMPEHDGYWTIREIRQIESQRKLPRLPAIALSAFSQPQDEIQTLAAGFQMHLAKPVDPNELISSLMAVTARKPQKKSSGHK